MIRGYKLDDWSLFAMLGTLHRNDNHNGRILDSIRIEYSLECHLICVVNWTVSQRHLLVALILITHLLPIN